MSDKSSKQYTTMLEYKALKKIDPRHPLLRLAQLNGQREFEFTDTYYEKFTLNTDMGDFQGYGRYRAALIKAKRELSSRT